MTRPNEGRSERANLTGFGNHFATEALAGSLPEGRPPQKPAHGLYAEQLSDGCHPWRLSIVAIEG